MGVADELARLVAHRDAGDLSDEEFQAAKADLLAHPERARTPPQVVEADPVSALRQRNRRRALVVAGLIVLALVGWVVVSEATLGGPRLEVHVSSISVVTPELVVVHATVSNVGGHTSLGLCQLTVRLRGFQSSSPFQTRPVAPDTAATGSARVIVAPGDAARVTARDVTLSCR